MINKIIFNKNLNNMDSIALISNSNYITYYNLKVEIDKCIKKINSLNLNQNEPVGLLMENSFEFVYWLLACFKTNHPVALIPFYFKEKDLVYHLNLLDINFFIIKNKAESFCNYNVIEKNKNYYILKLKNKGIKKYIYNNDDGVIQFTSGTMGENKAIVRTKTSLFAEVVNLKELIPLKDSNAFVPISPVYHSFGLLGGLLYPLCNHKTVVFVDMKFPLYSVKQICIQKVSHIFASPLMFDLISKVIEDNKNLDISFIQYCYTGGSNIDSSIVASFKNITGKNIYQDYGCTELGTIAIGVKPIIEDSSIGKYLNNINIRKNFIDDSERFELQIKKESLGFRYLYPKEMNSVKIKNGCFFTGDVFKSVNGKLYYEYRSDDCININGLKVYPGEIEVILNEIPEIAETCVVSKKQNVDKIKIIAYVVLKKNKRISASKIKEFCLNSLSSYKIPDEFVFIDELEKSPSGKIIKKEFYK